MQRSNRLRNLGGPARVTPVVGITEVKQNGWELNHNSPPTEFDPIGSPIDLSIKRFGYDTSANLVEYYESLRLMKRVRQPYPSQASLTANNAVASDYIYNTDIVFGVFV